MPKNEDGEFELILANRQLLSVFFIVVVLLGVFFTMGYIVGRNSAPLVGQEVATVRKPEAKPLVIDSPARDSAPAVQPSSPPPVETTPQQSATTETQKPPEPVQTKPAEVQRPKADQPDGGLTYLQLAATSQREAEIMVDVLRKRSFKALSAEIPDKPGMFRVLVGPMEEAAVNKMRADLQGAGFPGNAAIKRTF